MLIESLADGGVRCGLPRDLALRLAAQTTLGSAAMVRDGGHPAQLKDNVTSPAGSTADGTYHLEQNGKIWPTSAVRNSNASGFSHVFSLKCSLGLCDQCTYSGQKTCANNLKELNKNEISLNVPSFGQQF